MNIDKLTEISEQYLPLRDVVFRTIRNDILEGDLKPGERLMEIQISKRLGVSRTPIREAIRMLEREGLVTLIPRRGAFVAEMETKQLNDVLEVRRALEELAAELAAQRITREELEALAAAADEFDQAIETGDANVIAKADEQFHEIIISATGNDKLIELLNSFLKQIYRYRAAYVKHESVYGELKAEHRKILKGLEQGDVDMTMEAMFVHIDRQQKFMQELCADRAKK